MPFSPEQGIPSEAYQASEAEKPAEAKKETKEREPKPHFDAVVVFGAGVAARETTRPDKSKKTEWALPSQAKMRALAAYEIYKRGDVRELILTGGRVLQEKHPDAPSEAELMQAYIEHLALTDIKRKLRKNNESAEKIEQTLAQEQEKLRQTIRLEDKAINTIENFAHTLNAMDKEPDRYQNMALVSNQFHLPRIQKLAQLFGVEGAAISAESQAHARWKEKDRAPEDHYRHYQKFLDATTAPYSDPDRLAYLAQHYADEDPRLPDGFPVLPQEKIKSHLAGEERWEEGLAHMPEYWIPQAAFVNPQRLKEMIRINIELQSFVQERFGGYFESHYQKSVLSIEDMTDEEFADLHEKLKTVQREMPPKDWAIISTEQKYTSRNK